MPRELVETGWHFGLLLLLPAVKPRYRTLFVGAVVIGGLYHIHRKLTWRAK